MSLEELQQLAQEETGVTVSPDDVMSNVADSLGFFGFLSALQNKMDRDYPNFVGKTLREIHAAL